MRATVLNLYDSLDQINAVSGELVPLGASDPVKPGLHSLYWEA